jgi:hypothetical protein
MIETLERNRFGSEQFRSGIFSEHDFPDVPSPAEADAVALIASHKACDFSKSIRHRIARHFDAGGIEPGMGVDRLVPSDLVLSDSGAEMQHAVDAAPLEHDARGHGLGQAHRVEWNMARRPRHRPADLLGNKGPGWGGSNRGNFKTTPYKV